MIEVWIGLIEVRPKRKGVLRESALGAFVNVLAKVRDEEEFRRETGALLGGDFHLVRFDDVEPLQHRRSNWEVDEDLLKLAQTVEEEGLPRFGTFHSFSEDAHD